METIPNIITTGFDAELKGAGFKLGIKTGPTGTNWSVLSSVFVQVLKCKLLFAAIPVERE